MQAYPIFPWILKDYKSDTIGFQIDKQKGNIYRDLSKATTMFMDEDTIEDINERYNQRKETYDEEG